MDVKSTKKMSLSEYFQSQELKEAFRVDVTYEDGTKVALEGKVALMWWRLVHILLRDTQLRHPNVQKFRLVDKNGNLAPLTLSQMIEEHDWSTGICSFPEHMRHCSTTYNEIVKQSVLALPAILEYLRDHNVGMNIILLLEDITKTSPYKPEPIKGTEFVGYKVKDCVDMWLKWGVEQGYITHE